MPTRGEVRQGERAHLVRGEDYTPTPMLGGRSAKLSAFTGPLRQSHQRQRAGEVRQTERACLVCGEHCADADTQGGVR